MTLASILKFASATGAFGSADDDDGRLYSQEFRTEVLSVKGKASYLWPVDVKDVIARLREAKDMAGMFRFGVLHKA